MARITPLTPVVDLTRRRAQLRFRSDVRDSARHVFAVDLYSHLREKHPETHVGYWVFPLPEGPAESTIGIDLTRIGPGSLWMETADGPRSPPSTPGPTPTTRSIPIVGIQLVLRRDGRVLENRFVAGRVADPEVLRSTTTASTPNTATRPRSRSCTSCTPRCCASSSGCSSRHFAAGSRVLDAGCGRSLFTEIRPDWPFGIVAADVDLDLLAARQAEFPAVRWVVGDAHPLPFRDAAFDALFAGELIEHLPDPQAGRRGVPARPAPGGTLVLTTPNRLRLANVVDRSERPYSPDHLSELSYDEARALLRARGFDHPRRERPAPGAAPQLALAPAQARPPAAAVESAAGRCR